MIPNFLFCGDMIPFPAGTVTEWPDDIRIGNLECALAEGGAVSGKAYTSIVPFSCATTDNIGRFSALSLANNHVCDAGNGREMLDELRKRFPEVQFFGTADRPYAEWRFHDMRIAVIASLERCRSRKPLLFPEEKVKDLIRKLKKVFQRIYVCPHWGKESEYTRYPSPRQIRLAHAWIEAGADGIFGGHSHVFQGEERYAGKPVFYSLGNFYFPHPEGKHYEGTDGGLCVGLAPETGVCVPHFHRFAEGRMESADPESGMALLREISRPLKTWNYRQWGRKIGAFYLRKNMASWKLRLWKKFPVNFCKFLVWNFLPLTLWFRFCSLAGNEKKG